MRLLVDTHILIWHLEDDPRLSVTWSDLLENPEQKKFFSIASLWEIAIKTNVGKLKIQYPLDRFIPADFQILPIELSHLLAYQNLPLYHHDPFDRILIAQAQVEQLTLMTEDSNIPLYEVLLLS
jgi:PIN domain nuclease of toxin-antitoxin system